MNLDDFPMNIELFRDKQFGRDHVNLMSQDWRDPEVRSAEYLEFILSVLVFVGLMRLIEHFIF